MKNFESLDDLEISPLFLNIGLLNFDTSFSWFSSYLTSRFYASALSTKNL